MLNYRKIDVPFIFIVFNLNIQQLICQSTLHGDAVYLHDNICCFVRDTRLYRWWRYTSCSYVLWRCVGICNDTNDSEALDASIFRVKQGSMILRNDGILSHHYTASQARRWRPELPIKLKQVLW